MKKTLLFQLLNTFSVSELKRWSYFTHSDYHCKNKHLRHLSTIIVPIIKNKRTIEKQHLWAMLSPKANYNEIKLNNYLSDLLAVSYRFLEEETFVEQKNLRYEYLQQQLVTRGLKLQATRVAKKWEKNLNRSPLKDVTAIYDNFRYYYIQNTFSLLSKEKRAFGVHLQKKITQFEYFHLLQQLTNYAEVLNRGNIVKGDYELPYINELLVRYRTNKLDEQSITSIQIYVLIIEMLTDQDAENKFLLIEELMLQNQSCFSQSENRVIYNYLINFCVKKINSGSISYYNKLFSIYKTLIKESILIQNGSITQWTYTNIITIGLRLKEWEWTQAFLANYQEFLPKTEQHNAFYYNLAAFHFERKEYGDVLTLLNELRFADAFYQMAAKAIQLKIYYLQDQVETFDSLAAASRQFIFRNKQLSDYQQKSNINFIKLLDKMYTFRQMHKIWAEKKRTERLLFFKEKLTTADYLISHKGWLSQELEKLDG